MRRVGLNAVAGLAVLAISGCTKAPVAGNDPTIKQEINHEIPIAWRRPAAELGYPPDRWWTGTPATDGELVFIVAGGAVVALRESDGGIAWKTRYKQGSGAASENLIATQGQVLLADENLVAAVDAKTGALLWNTRIDSVIPYSAIAADAEMVYAGTSDGRAVALDRATGAVRWTTLMVEPAPYRAYSRGLSISGDIVYANALQYLNEYRWLSRGHVIALDRRTGRKLWAYANPDSASDAWREPQIVGDVVITLGAVHGFTGLDRFTGRVLWKLHPDNAPPAAGRIPDGAQVFFGGPFAADAKTGRLFWKAEAMTEADRVAVCGSRLIIQNQDLAILDRETGAVLSRSLNPEQGYLDDPISSGIGISNGKAFVLGEHWMTAVQCEPTR